MDVYNYEQLSSLIGKQVSVSDEQGNSVELTIAEVNLGCLNGDEWEAFSVIYSSQEPINIPQGTYSFYHQSFGNQDLFISPNSTTEFETVITRAKPRQTMTPPEPKVEV